MKTARWLIVAMLTPFAFACGTLLAVEPDPGSGSPEAGAEGSAEAGSEASKGDGGTEVCIADLQRDPNNCGTCGHSCGAMTCLGGKCVPDTCPAPAKGCANRDGGVDCVDVQTNVEHCGACAHTCNAGKACAAGECDRLVFVTSRTFTIDNGGFTSVAAADAACQSIAAARGFSNTFRAWLSDANDYPAKTFTQSNRPYRLLSGAPIATSFGSMIANQGLAAPLNEDELGNGVSGNTKVWTGTRADGQRAPAENCAGWSDNLTESALAGDVSQLGPGWTEGSLICSTSAHLYCFEQ